ncbi:MAG TPA: hypothetical protein PLH31_00155 [Caulobacter sp.]|nr:hypothetical protein [Caulobacter sp.]
MAQAFVTTWTQLHDDPARDPDVGGTMTKLIEGVESHRVQAVLCLRWQELGLTKAPAAPADLRRALSAVVEKTRSAIEKDDGFELDL